MASVVTSETIKAFEAVWRGRIFDMAKRYAEPPYFTRDDLYSAGLEALWEVLDMLPGLTPDDAMSNGPDAHSDFSKLFKTRLERNIYDEIRPMLTQKRSKARDFRPDGFEAYDDAGGPNGSFWDQVTTETHKRNSLDPATAAEFVDLCQAVEHRLDDDARLVFQEYLQPSEPTRVALQQHLSSIRKAKEAETLPMWVIAQGLVMKTGNETWNYRRVRWIRDTKLRPVMQEVFGPYYGSFEAPTRNRETPIEAQLAKVLEKLRLQQEVQDELAVVLAKLRSSDGA